MKTYNLTLTESQLSSLKTFLERTELRGREAHLFFELVDCINRCEKDSQPTQSVATPATNKGKN